MPSSSARNHRNNPYVLDRAFATVHHSAAGVIWRFRTELAILLAGTASAWELDRAVTASWAVIILTASAAVIMVLPWTRRLVIRRACCVLSRHRIQRVCFETRMHTRSGQAPPGPAHQPDPGRGTRTDLVPRRDLRRGLRGALLEIAAACYARQARIEGSRRWAQLVTLDIVRRDTLASHHVVPSGLARNRHWQTPAA